MKCFRGNIPVVLDALPSNHPGFPARRLRPLRYLSGPILVALMVAPNLNLQYAQADEN
jgi:hypothetical protein